MIHDYACCHRHMFARGVTGLSDVSHFAPRYIVTGVWALEGGRSVSLDGKKIVLE